MNTGHLSVALALVAVAGLAAATGAAQQDELSPLHAATMSDTAPNVSPIDAIRQAQDPSAAVAAYTDAIHAGADELEATRAYVDQMIELDAPELAHAQARDLAQREPDNGRAWAVVAAAHARQGKMAAALSVILTAVRRQPGDAFVQRTAGELLAWYDTQAVASPELRNLKPKLEALRTELTGYSAFAEAYQQARGYYESAASAEERSKATPETPPRGTGIVVPPAPVRNSYTANTYVTTDDTYGYEPYPYSYGYEPYPYSFGYSYSPSYYPWGGVSFYSRCGDYRRGYGWPRASSLAIGSGHGRYHRQGAVWGDRGRSSYFGDRWTRRADDGHDRSDGRRGVFAVGGVRPSGGDRQFAGHAVRGQPSTVGQRGAGVADRGRPPSFNRTYAPAGRSGVGLPPAGRLGPPRTQPSTQFDGRRTGLPRGGAGRGPLYHQEPSAPRSLGHSIGGSRNAAGAPRSFGNRSFGGVQSLGRGQSFGGGHSFGSRQSFGGIRSFGAGPAVGGRSFGASQAVSGRGGGRR